MLHTRSKTYYRSTTYATNVTYHTDVAYNIGENYSEYDLQYDCALLHKNDLKQERDLQHKCEP